MTAINTMLAAMAAAQPVSPTSTPTDETQGDVKISWEMNHFIRGAGGIAYVPFTLSVDRRALSSEKAVISVRAVAKNAAPAPAAPPAQENRGNNRNNPAPAVSYPWNDFDFVALKDDGKLSRAMMLPAGEYDLFIVAKDQSTGDSKQVVKSGTLRKKISVPDFNKAELTVSSLLLGAIDELPSPLPANQQRDNPYTFGQMKVTPTTTGKFAKTSELSLVFWIYGAGTDAISRRPNVTVDYSFYQKNADGTEKYFNKTAPQDLNDKTLPPDMDAAAGLPGVMSVPMMVFPAGDYRLEIKVSDKASGKSTVLSQTFTVNPA